MTDEQIIKQIKLHPVLFNTRLSQYRDLEARNIAWDEIARNVNLDVEDVKIKWGKLRNSYTNALKRRYKKNSCESLRIMPWKFQKEMEFLLPHLKYKNKKMKSDVSKIINSSVKDESFPPFIDEYDAQLEPLSPASSAKYVSPIEDNIERFSPIENHEDKTTDSQHLLIPDEVKYKNPLIDMDENDYFFLSMSKVLKKLPQEVQADIKFELHKLIYEAEKRQLRRSSSLY